MAEERNVKKGYLTPVVTILSFTCSVLQVLFKEVTEVMPVFNFIKVLSAIVDPIMAIWVVVIMIAGYWLKRANLPSWMPALPVLLLTAFLVISFLFGWMQNSYTGWKGVQYVLLYGIGNGLFFTSMSFVIYDTVHETLKQRRKKKDERDKT